MARNVVIPRWSKNLGYMLAYAIRAHNGPYPAEFFLGCSKCQTRVTLTIERLAELIQAKGPLYSVWNRHPKCARCGGKRYYSGSSGGPGAIVFPFTADTQDVTVVSLHQRWKAEKQQERTRG